MGKSKKKGAISPHVQPSKGAIFPAGQNSPKNGHFSQGSEPHVGEQKKPSDVSKNEILGQFSRGSEPTTENNPFLPASEIGAPVLISGHRLKWAWDILEGTPQRGAFKAVKMRNWEKRIWKRTPGILDKNTVIVCNPRTLEVWRKSRPLKNADSLIGKNALEACRAAWLFSKWQGLVIRLRKSAHPDDLQAGHFVLETKRLNPVLEPQAGLPSSKRLGLLFDYSHGRKPEFTGAESAEGANGADYLFLDFPPAFRKMQAEIEELRRLVCQARDESAATAQGIGEVALLLRNLPPRH